MIEPAPVVNEPKAPQPEFKVGDRVRVRKPKDDPTWIDCAMDAFDGFFCTVREECEGRLLLHNCGEWKFKPEWLSPDPDVNECLTTDNVNHPPHYNQGGIECIEAIKAALGDGFVAYLRGNVLKYLWRCEHKGGIEDLRKAAFYLDRAIEEMEATSE
jgi:hypothetical protein